MLKGFTEEQFISLCINWCLKNLKELWKTVAETFNYRDLAVQVLKFFLSLLQKLVEVIP